MAGVIIKAHVIRDSSRGELRSRHVLPMASARTVAWVSLKPHRMDHLHRVNAVRALRECSVLVDVTSTGVSKPGLILHPWYYFVRFSK